MTADRRFVLLALVLAACGPGVDPVGDWAMRITPGPGDCQIPATGQTINVSRAGNAYSLEHGDPTYTGTIDCNDDRCVLDFYQTLTGAQEHATWTLTGDGNIAGTGSVMVVQSSTSSCMQALTFTGVLQ